MKYTYIYLSDILGGHPYVRHDVMHTCFVKILLEISSRSRPMGPGPTSITLDFFSKTTENCAYSLTPPSNQTEICSQFLFQDSK